MRGCMAKMHGMQFRPLHRKLLFWCTQPFVLIVIISICRFKYLNYYLSFDVCLSVCLSVCLRLSVCVCEKLFLLYGFGEQTSRILEFKPEGLEGYGI